MTEVFIKILNISAPIIAAMITGGGIVGYFQYKASKEKNIAEARHINVTSEISIAKAWREYVQDVEKRFKEMEEKYDKAIQQKDAQIAQLTNDIKRLTRELEGCTKIATI